MNWQQGFKFDKVTTKNFGGHKDEVQVCTKKLTICLLLLLLSKFL